MATPFANTLRSLNADRLHGSLIGLGVAVVLLITWGSWFLLARVTIYEASASAVVAGDGFVIADFPSARRERIHQGQAAWLYPVEGGVKQAVDLPAVVIDIMDSPAGDLARVRLFPYPDRDLSEVLPVGRKVRVDIEVESVPPIVMVLHKSGFLVDTPGVALSPQPERSR